MDEEILALIDARAAEDVEFAALVQPRQNDGAVAADAESGVIPR